MTKHSGFSLTKITVPMLRPVTISWSEDGEGEGIGVRQITNDGSKFVAVRNGWNSGPLRQTGSATFKFSALGEIKLASLGIRSTPLSITVVNREDFVINVTDEGFKPSVAYIYENTNVIFKWSGW